MNDKFNIRLDSNEEDLSIEKKIKKEMSIIANYVKKIDGGKIFLYDRISNEYRLATYSYSDIYILGVGDIFNKNQKINLNVEQGCDYMEAINIKNAKKHHLLKNIIFKS